jgi:hypothetical protein
MEQNQNSDLLIEQALAEASQIENSNNKQVRFEPMDDNHNPNNFIPNNLPMNNPNSIPSNQLNNITQSQCSINGTCNDIDGNDNTNEYFSQHSPMNTLFDSLKWTIIVVLFIFVFSSPKLVNMFVSIVPSQLKSGDGLSVVGNGVYLLIPALIFFVLYHFIL